MSIEVDMTYKTERGDLVDITFGTAQGYVGYPAGEPRECPIRYDAFGVPVNKALWDDGWALVLDTQEDDWKCPHCGSTKGTWFDRTITVTQWSKDGSTSEEGMATRCSDCGKDVDAPEEDDGVNSPSHYTVGGFEALDVIRAKLTKEEFRGYCKGNTLKYLMRANYKNDHDKDCKKAAYYGNKLEDSL